MARTLKRQRARALRDQHPISPSTVVQTEEALWMKVEDALLGLLDIQVDNSTTDVDHLCPRSVMLVFRLDLVRGGASERPDRELQKAMDALAVLCVLAEEVYKQSEKFWSRVIFSHMMLSPSWNVDQVQAKIDDIVTFSRAYGLQVKLSWQNRRFQKYAANAIASFLQSPRCKYRVPLRGHQKEVKHSARLVRVGLQFIECKLAAYDLIRVMEALAVPDLTAESDFDDVPLCGTQSLQSLVFKGITFGVASLNALAVGLASPHTRRIDGLSLEDAIALTNSPKYLPAFRRVMVAALQAKHVDTGSCCPGLKLSLADNSMIQAVHIEAFQESLALATRSLSSLCVAGIYGGDIGTWLRLGQILFTPSRIPVDGGFELDMSRVRREREAVETLSTSLGNIVSELLPRVATALLASETVYCRVLEPTAELIPRDECRVLSVRSNGLGSGGWLLVETPAAAENATWVSSSSITSLRIEDEDIVCCRFTRLTMDGGCSDDDNEAIVAFTQIIGHHLQRLTLGERRYLEPVLPRIMDTCPNLQILGLSSSSIYQRGKATSWTWAKHHRNIQAICLNQSYLSDTSVLSLLLFLTVSTHHSLRYLDLRVNFHLDPKMLEALLEVVQANRALVCVDIHRSLVDKAESEEEKDLRGCIQDIDDFFHAEYLSVEIKLAFLGVVRQLKHLHLDGNIVRNVFDFTGSRYKRMLRRD